MSDAMTISVVIPVHNRSKELVRALKSVSKQTRTPTDVKIIDDASEDNISAVLGLFPNMNIEYYRFEQKVNANVARNKGVNLSNSEYIAFLDSDDEWTPDHINDSLNWIEENALRVCFGGFYVINGVQKKRVLAPNIDKSKGIVSYLYGEGVFATATLVIKRDLILTHRWDDELERQQDVDLGIRLWNAGVKMIPKPSITTYIHWTHEGPRKVNVGAVQRFSEKHESVFTPQQLFEYYRNHYHTALVTKNIPQTDRSFLHFKSRKLAKNLSSYFSIDNPKSFTQKMIAAIRFYSVILR